MPRKYLDNLIITGQSICSFNEAGADAPEIPGEPSTPATACLGFNEAGADAPEIRFADAEAKVVGLLQ